MNDKVAVAMAAGAALQWRNEGHCGIFVKIVNWKDAPRIVVSEILNCITSERPLFRTWDRSIGDWQPAIQDNSHQSLLLDIARHPNASHWMAERAEESAEAWAENFNEGYQKQAWLETRDKCREIKEQKQEASQAPSIEGERKKRVF